MEFKSGIPGSGNDMTYVMTLPRDPKAQPNGSGVGGTTWNFQLRPTFWFGLALCDSQSAPEFTTQCTPDSDSNNLVGTNPNGFGHILYTPNSSTCQEAPYAFHPEYSTANPRGTSWAFHTYNVAMSDEIGHFENCLAIDANGNCISPGAQDPSVDGDDVACLPGTDSTLVKIDIRDRPAGYRAPGRAGQSAVL